MTLTYYAIVDKETGEFVAGFHNACIYKYKKEAQGEMKYWHYDRPVKVIPVKIVPIKSKKK